MKTGQTRIIIFAKMLACLATVCTPLHTCGSELPALNVAAFAWQAGYMAGLPSACLRVAC